MNEEQIRDAADTAYLEDYFPLNEDPDHHWDIFNNGFIKGARWHESLPLAERLAESEKMQMIMINEVAKGLYVSDPDRKEYYRSQWETLETIFGSNLFTPTEQ